MRKNQLFENKKFYCKIIFHDPLRNIVESKRKNYKLYLLLFLLSLKVKVYWMKNELIKKNIVIHVHNFGFSNYILQSLIGMLDFE